MFYLIIIIWIIIDLSTKNLALNYLQERVDIFWSFLYLEYVENTGIAFSIQIPTFFLKILTISLIIWIFYYYRSERNKLNVIPAKAGIYKNVDTSDWFLPSQEWQAKLLDLSFWLILAWAIWNWVERILEWKVIDFIGVKYFAVFNLADSFITIGAIIYLYVLYKTSKKQ